MLAPSIKAVTSVMVLVIAVPRSTADLITFEGHGTNSNPDQIVSSEENKQFNFSFIVEGGGIFTDNFVHEKDDPVFIKNGTTRLVVGGDKFVGTRATIDITPVVLIPFSLVNFNAAKAFTFVGGDGGVEVTGTIIGGGSVVATFTLTNDFNTVYNLPDTFVNLNSVRFRNTISGAYGKEPGFALDNLQLSAVPEPSTLVLSVTAGLAMLICLSPQLRHRLSATPSD